MQTIRRTVLAFTASLIALVAGTGTAFAFPPEIRPEPTSGTTGGGASSSGGFLDGWPQVTLAILVVAAVLVAAAVGVSRLRHHTPSHA